MSGWPDPHRDRRLRLAPELEPDPLWARRARHLLRVAAVLVVLAIATAGLFAVYEKLWDVEGAFQEEESW